MRRVGADKFSNLQWGVVATLAVILICYLGFTKASNPFANPYELKAAFTTAHQIKPKSPVRIAGVNVGKVTKVEVLGDKGAMVTMAIEDKGLPVHSDAKVKIRPRIFLEGNYFVDLQPGSPSADELDSGATIPVTRTASPVGFGRLLETLQYDTREDLKAIFQELGEGFSKGGGEATNRASRYWKDAFQHGSLVNDATRGVLEHDLSEYVKHAGKVAQALDRDPAALKSLVTNFAITADALADEAPALERAIGVLDDTLVQGTRTLGELNRAFPPLRRLVAALRPATRAAGPALDAQLQLLPQMRGLVTEPEMKGLARDMRTLVPHLVHLNKGGVQLQEQSRMLSNCQLQVTLPTVESRIPDSVHKPSGKVYETGVKWMPGIAGESRSMDANGQYIKTLGQTANYAYATGNGRFAWTTLPVQGVNPPPKPDGHSPLRPEVPCETQEPPDLRSRATDPPQAIKVNRNTAAYRERAPKALARAVKWLRGQVKYEGLEKDWIVSSKPRVGR